MSGTAPSPSASHVEPTTVFNALADMIYQGSTPEEIYAAICIAATLMVPGCEHASIMLRHKDTYTTIAANDSVAREVDQLEQALNEGPCLDAIEKEAPQVDPDLSTRSRWPVLAARVIAETPVRGVMGFRLLVGRRKVGALNLFSDTSSTFDKVSVERATLLAAFATVATNAVAQGEDEASLQRALVSNREIGKAIGILMMLNDISEDQAFNMLRRISQDTNVRLAAIAAKIVRRQNSTA